MKAPAKPPGFEVWFVTLRIETPVTPPDTAVMEVKPALTPAAKLLGVTCPVPSTVATAALVDAQVAVAVKSCVLPSLKCPVAVNGCAAPLSAITGYCGLTNTISRVGFGGGGGGGFPPPEPPPHAAMQRAA